MAVWLENICFFWRVLEQAHGPREMARELLQALPPSVADVLGADGVFGDATDCKTAVVTVEGRVTRKKWFSSRLFFFDVSTVSALPPHPCPEPPLSGDLPARADEQVSGASVDPDAFVGEKLLSAARLACIYRQGAQHDRGILGAADVVELSSQFELGDYVRVQYSPQSQKTAERSVQVRRLEVLRAWRHSHGDEPALDTDTAPVVTDPNTRRAPKGEVCKFWVNSGRCPLRACKLKHVPEEERKAARDAWQAQRRLEREETQRRQAAAIGDNFEAGGHKKQHKKNRAAIFCSWLVHTFGLERLKQGAPTHSFLVCVRSLPSPFFPLSPLRSTLLPFSTRHIASRRTLAKCDCPSPRMRAPVPQARAC
jgi:hypothetical protein